MSKELSYLEAIREALIEEMRRDPKVFVLGEDVGPYGGAFGVTQGLYDSLLHFCRCALDGVAPTQGTLESAAHLMRVYEAAMRSRGDRVAIPG